MRGEKRLAEWWPSVACRIALAIGPLMTLSSAALAQVGADFNGDGFDDLAIGVPGEDVGNATDAGAVNVLYGSATGLQATGVGGPPDQFWHQDVTDVDSTAETGDGFGTALATGDFNNDGFDDLAIGVPYEDSTVAPDVGVVNVLYGSPAGLQTGGSGRDDQLWHQDSTDVLGTAEESDYFGSALVAGDFNHDGYDDLAVGVPYEDIAGWSASGTGAVNLLYGSVAGLQANGRGAPDDDLWQQGIAGVKGSAKLGDLFGSALGVGDFNGDSFDDLAIGVPHEDIGLYSDAGVVNVLYGSAAGLQANGVGGPDDQYWHQDGFDVENNVELDDRFGSSLAAGDFNGDDEDDLAIGVPGEMVEDEAGEGAVNVLYGSAAGLQASGVGGLNDQFWNEDVLGFVPTAIELFGYDLGAGDFNNDGRDDLAVGVPQESLAGTFFAGAVFVLYGSATGLQANGVGGPDDQYWHQDSTGIAGDGIDGGDQFGSALAVGDFNDDGRDDLAVGVPFEDVVFVEVGAVNVLYGSAAGLQATGVGAPNDQFWHQLIQGVEDVVEAEDHFGSALP